MSKKEKWIALVLVIVAMAELFIVVSNIWILILMRNVTLIITQ